MVKKYVVLLGCSILLFSLFLGGCAKYTPPSGPELAARQAAYEKCKQASVANITVSDPRDAMILALIAKMPGSDDCAKLLTSGDDAQVAIAQSNADLGKKLIGGFTVVGGVVADNLGDKWLADSVGKSAGTHTTGDGNTTVSGNQTTTTTTIETTAEAPAAAAN
jgi:hypothetical protein